MYANLMIFKSERNVGLDKNVMEWDGMDLPGSCRDAGNGGERGIVVEILERNAVMPRS